MTSGSNFNDLNIFALSHCRSRFCAGLALLEPNKSLLISILHDAIQKISRWTSNKGRAQERRKSSILNILRVSPYGSRFCRRKKPSGDGKPLQFNILREFEEKNRTRLRCTTIAFSIIYPQNLGNKRLIPEATQAPVPPAGARAGETPTAPPPVQRSAPSGIPARSCAAARSAPPPGGIAR